ncbi:MAG: RNA methyltransferase [Bacteroidota bacterium]
MAEGPKIISDLVQAGLKIHSLFSLEEAEGFGVEAAVISPAELQKISALKTANSMLAVFYLPEKPTLPEKGLVVALDAVRDPGNLGTIIRLCDWFGVKALICSEDTADCFNPKVVQATMGSIARVGVSYTDLSDYLQSSRKPIYAAVMDGGNVYNEKLPKDAVLVMGNEANGISEAVLALIQHKITIPNFGDVNTAESLNVATATGILLSEFRRSIET